MPLKSAPLKRHFFFLSVIFLIYYVVTRAALQLPHWDMPDISCLNYDLFFIIMLLSFFVFLREPNYPYIFLNLAIFSLFYLSGFVVIFSGVDYLFGDDKLPYILWAYRKIIISVMTCIMVIYIPTSYIFNNVKSSYRYLISFVIVLPISAFYFRSFLLDW